MSSNNSPCSVQEVRQGLFCIQVLVNEKIWIQMKNSFVLKTRNFTTYDFYCSTDRHKGGLLTLVLNSLRNTDKVSCISDRSVEGDETEEEHDHPAFVWASFDNGETVALTESSCPSPSKSIFRSWGPVSYHPSYQSVPATLSTPIKISLWMDFGAVPDSLVTVLDNFAKLLDNGTLSDVEFTVRGEKMSGHVSCLVAQSPVFHAMFQHNMKETLSRTVDIVDVEPEIFRQFLMYLYSGRAPRLQDDDVTEALFVVADKYGVEALKRDCAKCLHSKLSNGNVVRILGLAYHHPVARLYKAALNFVVKNGKHILFTPEWKDLAMNYPEICLEAAQLLALKLPVNA